MYQVVDNLSHQAGAHALRAGVDFLLQRRHASRFRAPIRGSYTFSSLANFLAGVYNNAGFTQTFGDPWCRRRNPNVGVYAQDEWKVAPRLTLNVGLRYDLQFLETIDTDTQQRLAAASALRGRRRGSRRTVVRGSAGLFFDRVPLRAVANALLSAGNTTDLAQLRQIERQPVAGAGRRAGVSDILPTSCRRSRCQPDDDGPRTCRMRIRGRRASRSSSRSATRATVSVGYQYLRGQHLLMSINQNVPTCVAVRHEQRLPAESRRTRTTASTRRCARLELSRPARVVRAAAAAWGKYRVSYTLSKSMNNVGEFFFSSPIDPFDISKDWGRSDDDQRHRVVVYGVVNSPTAPGATTGTISHGFQVSSVVHAYLRCR